MAPAPPASKAGGPAADTATTQYGSLPAAALPEPAPTTMRKHRSGGGGGGGGLSGGFKPSRKALTAALLLVVGLGSANSLTYKIMFAAYGESAAFFVSTGVNALYILYGGLILYPRMLLTDKVTPEMRRLPKTRFVVMGLLDCLGTFLAAMGAVYTPGQVQTLLNQTLIPVTMLASALYLRTRFSPIQLLGAALVLSGAIFSSAATDTTGPHQQQQQQGQESRWYANLVYFLSNIPVACSQVYKEKSFKRDRVDVIYLTQWVSIFQFGFGLLLAPLQAVPGVGSAHGVSMAQVARDFGAGWRCFLERDGGGGGGDGNDAGGRCQQRHTFALLTGYCALNIVYNTAGLYVAKHGSAALNVLTYALLLPITTLLFSVRPLLGPYTEPLRPTTLVALAVVVLGFSLYQRPVVAEEEEAAAASALRKQRRARAAPEQREAQGLLLAPTPRFAKSKSTTSIGVQVPSFQERVVAGLGPAIVRVSVSVSPAPASAATAAAATTTTTAPGTEEEEDGVGGSGGWVGGGQQTRPKEPPVWMDVI